MTEPIATEPVVSVRALSKTYRVYAKAFDRLVEGVFGGTRHSAFDALQDVSFELEPGEGLAVIGENGAGKSTLLKILAGVTAASAGSLEVKGKVASILELGSGFHPELTGRQNIVLNAAMLGLTPAEVEAKTPEIIAFSELGGFIDQPVKCYSTGMAMRLGFAIATQVEPDVLIIDEALSVGDGYFQKKCMDKLKAYVGGGGTLLFCSHAMYYVSAFCRRALWLRGGRVEALGPVDAVVRSYENFLLQKEAAAAKPAVEPSPSTGPARFLDVAFEAGRREAGRLLYRYREPCTVRLAFEARDAELELHVGVGIDRVDGVQVVNFSTFHDGHPPFTGKHRYELTLEVPELPLLKVEFTAHLFLVDEKALHVYDARTLPQVFSIEAEGFPIGIMRVPHRWQETSPEPAALEAASMG